MPDGVFDVLQSAFQSGSVGEGIGKITDAIMTPNAATIAAKEKEKADLAAKGMVPTAAGNLVSKRDIYGRDIKGNLAEPIAPAKPKAMPPPPASLLRPAMEPESSISNPVGYAMGVADRSQL
jgi:hypothetical protein